MVLLLKRYQLNSKIDETRYLTNILIASTKLVFATINVVAFNFFQYEKKKKKFIHRIQVDSFYYRFRWACLFACFGWIVLFKSCPFVLNYKNGKNDAETKKNDNFTWFKWFSLEFIFSRFLELVSSSTTT